MTSRPEVPTQLQFPLVRPIQAPSRARPRTGPRASLEGRRPGPSSPPPVAAEDHTRLDEQTRTIGRQGIAAARARLAAAVEPAVGSPGPTGQVEPGHRTGDRGVSGHAA